MSDSTTPTGLTTYWQQQIDQWKTSGQSQAKFCQTHDLLYHRFVYWRRKFDWRGHRVDVTRVLAC